MKLAFVVQRYGADIAGGSEGHCRELAERLSGATTSPSSPRAPGLRDVGERVPAGAPVENGVPVHPVSGARPRRMKVFADLSDEVFEGGASRERQEEWFRENGPETPGAARVSPRTRARVRPRRVLDVPLLPVVLRLAARRGPRRCSCRRPRTMPPINLDVLPPFFDKPAGYMFLTPEEEQLVSSRAYQASPAVDGRRASDSSRCRLTA